MNFHPYFHEYRFIAWSRDYFKRLAVASNCNNACKPNYPACVKQGKAFENKTCDISENTKLKDLDIKEMNVMKKLLCTISIAAGFLLLAPIASAQTDDGVSADASDRQLERRARIEQFRQLPPEERQAKRQDRRQRIDSASDERRRNLSDRRRVRDGDTVRRREHADRHRTKAQRHRRQHSRANRG